MHSFDAYLLALHVPMDVLPILEKIGTYRGRQDLYRERAPEILQELRESAIIRSVESSNSLENITATRNLEDILAHPPQQKKPTDTSLRNEYELIGYHNVLSRINARYKHMTFTDSLVLQLHRDLLKPAGLGYGGAWKNAPNPIKEGDKVRFETLPPHLTPDYMRDLHQRLKDEMAYKRYSSLLLIALYILDFLCIHPFLDGNGRMARLLAHLLLLQQGHEVPRYISIERIIEERKEGYYDSLYKSSQGWHEKKHDPWYWVHYFLQTILQACEAWDSDIKETEGGSEKERVLRALRRVEREFSLRRLEKMCSGVTRESVRRILHDLQEQGQVVCMSKGRYARWRITSSFGQGQAHGDKSKSVLAEIERRGDNPFTIRDIVEACPHVSRDWIHAILNTQREQGRLSCSGRGRGAYWHRTEES
ncbi:MAG: Fic family protein [Alphaproteobacteria bacterium GM202ARS2]|nr:Fic family protein [Alphaproteobacteria bacterium GM202ARS2]